MNRFTAKSLAFSFNRFYTEMINAMSDYLYNKNYRYFFKKQGFRNSHVEGEDQYLSKWRVLQRNITPLQYRFFFNYAGVNPNIVPEEVSHNIIEPILNPIRYRFYYEDKNIYDKLFPKEYTAQTILRRMGGFYYDEYYNKINDLMDEDLNFNSIKRDKIIIKPTVDSASGVGVLLFQRDGDVFKQSSGDKILSVRFLESFYGCDFIIQECLRQSDFMSMFNATSVNTIRMLVYRSVIDDSIHIINAVIRMGGKGAFVDNAHAGGVFIGLSSEGKLGKYICSCDGDRANSHNGIDFINSDFHVPNYHRAKEFAIEVASCVTHHRCLAMDIMIDQKGDPRLIEFNISGLSTWLYQFAGTPAFGKYTDEIIEYCYKNKKKAEKVFLKFV